MQWFHDLTIFCLNISNFAIITVAMLIIVEFFYDIKKSEAIKFIKKKNLCFMMMGIYKNIYQY